MNFRIKKFARPERINASTLIIELNGCIMSSGIKQNTARRKYLKIANTVIFVPSPMQIWT